MKYHVFNNSIGSQYNFGNPEFSAAEQDRIIASLFEQLLVFDTVTISTNRLNYTLTLLINRLGIDTVKRLLEHGYLKIMLFSPMLLTGRGRKLEDSSMDESVIYGQPPIATGSLSEEDVDPERNIHNALSQFNINREQKRAFTRIATQHYIVPDGMVFSANAGKIVIDAYTSNNLAPLGLGYQKDPDQLNLDERGILLDLGHNVLETALVSEYNLKSYGDNKIPAIYGQNLKNIGTALKVVDNTTSLMKIEGVPNLQELFLQEKLDFDNVFKLRYLSSAKYYRNWINTISENENALEITVEYLNEIKGNNKFFASNRGKLVRNIGVFGVGLGLGVALAGPVGAAIGAIGGKAAEFGLGLLDTYVLDGLLMGKNPSMFIEDVKHSIKN